MLVPTFCEKYDVSKMNVYVCKHDGTLPSNIFKGVPRSREMMIDEKFFTRRLDFKQDVKMFNHDMYYYLTEFFSLSHIAQTIAKYYDVSAETMVTYFSSRLFVRDESSVLRYKVTKLDWIFFRFGRKIMLKLNRKYGIKFDVGYILDRRMQQCI